MDRIFDDFFGLNTYYHMPDGALRRRVYLDSAASTLAMRSACKKREALLSHYASVHTTGTTSSNICTEAFLFAQHSILEFFGFSPEEYYCVFTGSGATAALNRTASLLSRLCIDRDTVVLSLMEHHSNDLPHRSHFRNVIHIDPADDSCGAINLKDIEDVLANYRVGYIAITACSNVTGVLNPIEKIAELARLHGAFLVVDGSQLAVHDRLHSVDDIDVFVFPGHKAYAPGTPGVLIIRKQLFDAAGPVELGGGIIHDVSKSHFELAKNHEARTHAGTPDVLGAFQIAMVFKAIDGYGFENLISHEKMLIERLFHSLKEIEAVRFYGTPTRVAHTGVISFNLAGLNHKIVAWALNRYFNISVRSGCFCAHPYVRHLMRDDYITGLATEEEIITGEFVPGMVRVSVAAYTNTEDIDTFTQAIKTIIEDKEFYVPNYQKECDQIIINGQNKNSFMKNKILIEICK